MLVRDRSRSRSRHPPPPAAWRSACAILCLLTLTSTAAAQDGSPPLEFQVKAAFLYNFAKFARWPSEAFPDADAAFVVCVLDDETLASALAQAVLGKTVEGRGFRVRRMSAADDAGSCQVLYLGAMELPRLAGMIKSLRGEPVLTIGETPGFAREGGIINLIIRDNHIRFEINPDAAERAGLRISSKLLQLAAIVRDEAGTEDGR